MSDESRLTANSSAGLEKFTDMIFELLGVVWGPKWGVFSEEKPVDNDPDKHTLPHITYNLASRRVKDKTNPKGTDFTTKDDPVHDGEVLTYRKRWFTCMVEFTIYDDTNKGARITAERFEEFMQTYTGYFKQEGVSEIIFKEEKAPDVNSFSRQDLPYRTLVYQVNIEQTHVKSSYTLKQVDVHLGRIELDTTVQHPSGNQDQYESTISKEDTFKTHLGPSNFLEHYHNNFPSKEGGN